MKIIKQKTIGHLVFKVWSNGQLQLFVKNTYAVISLEVKETSALKRFLNAPNTKEIM